MSHSILLNNEIAAGGGRGSDTMVNQDYMQLKLILQALKWVVGYTHIEILQALKWVTRYF